MARDAGESVMKKEYTFNGWYLKSFVKPFGASRLVFKSTWIHKIMFPIWGRAAYQNRFASLCRILVFLHFNRCFLWDKYIAWPWERYIRYNFKICCYHPKHKEFSVYDKKLITRGGTPNCHRGGWKLSIDRAIKVFGERLVNEEMQEVGNE